MSNRGQEIITAAAQVFLEKGYHAATTRDIAAAVGIQQASLYYYISSKEELLYLIVREPVMRLADQLDTIVKAAWPTRQKIERGLQAHLAAFDDNYPHMCVFVQELHNVIPALQDTLRDLPQRYQQLWEDIIRQGIARGELRAEFDVTTTALMILGMCNWMFRWYRKGGRLSTVAIAQQYASAILDGMVAPSASRASV
jgi:AcrR family transcriptional regulator